jgi:hypothetical protein
MKNWFLSLHSAITFSILALITEAWRGFLDAMYILPVEYPDESLLNMAAVIFTILFSGWTWALIAASRGSRSGLWAAFIINLLVLLAVPVSWLFVYCPAACQAEAGIFNLANTLNLIFGVMAGLTLGVQIWGPQPRQSTTPLGAEA